MKRVRRLVLIIAVVLAIPSVRAQTPSTMDIRVAETTGIRRNAYPATARILFPRGTLLDAVHVRLLAAGKDVPAQFGAEALYPDASVQWLTVDFNPSVGPFETALFQLEYGAAVEPAATPRGLTVTEDTDGVQVGSVRFSKTGAPLFLSVRYRREDIGQGPNGLAIVDTAGVSHDAAGAEQVKMQIVKRGPLLVEIRYSGELRINSAYTVGYVETVEMPSSKSWVKVTTALIDPERRVGELSFHTPFTFGPQPWSWDYGTGSWSYGLLRTPVEGVTLTQRVGAPQDTTWEIKAGPKGQELIAEASGGHRPKVVEGWGHIQDQQEVIAFAVPDFGAEAGTYAIGIDGAGQSSFRFAPANPLPYLRMTVYEHFVSAPVAVGAVTSPVSMLNPLVVSFSPPR